MQMLINFSIFALRQGKHRNGESQKKVRFQQSEKSVQI